MRAPKPYNSKRAIALQAALYGPRIRDDVVMVREFHEAARGAVDNACRWLTFLPTPAAVEAMRSNVAGMARVLADLAAFQQGGRQHDE